MQMFSNPFWEYKKELQEKGRSSLSVPERHQLKIAKDTLKMSDSGAKIMGGMTKKEARTFLKKHGYSDNAIAKLEEEQLTEKYRPVSRKDVEDATSRFKKKGGKIKRLPDDDDPKDRRVEFSSRNPPRAVNEDNDENKKDPMWKAFNKYYEHAERFSPVKSMEKFKFLCGQLMFLIDDHGTSQLKKEVQKWMRNQMNRVGGDM